MTKRKSGGSNEKPPEGPTEPANANLPTGPQSSSKLIPAPDRLKPGSSAAEKVYRAAQTCALIEARRVSQSEEEAIILLPEILAKLMVGLNIAALAEAFAKAKDPNIFKMQLVHELAVDRYRRLTIER